jgi:hypothetical protein
MNQIYKMRHPAGAPVSRPGSTEIPQSALLPPAIAATCHSAPNLQPSRKTKK